MSIIISGIRLPFDRPEEEAVHTALTRCGLHAASALRADIYRCSIDARHGKVQKVYSVCVHGVEEETHFVEALHDSTVRCKSDAVLEPVRGSTRSVHRPVVIGMGPAGLFAAYELARYGYCPLVFERGDDLTHRDDAVKNFFEQGMLDEACNIQFGEGGAGAYSDGKLTTRINDPRCESVLRTLVEHGAPEEILRQAKPHIGTDILKNVVRAMRESILAAGGEVRFRAPLTGLETRGDVLAGVRIDGQGVPCERAVLAIGHSARDTFAWLANTVYMEPKAFSVGARIEHAQVEIDRMLYGRLAGHPALPPAEYTLSHRDDKRACYSFCMCPGGEVVAAQSEANTVVTNGMSYHARDGRNANAAIVVSVEPSDFPESGALGGVAFQREIERTAYRLTGSYQAPCQRVGDFMEGRRSTKCGQVRPTYPRGVQLGTIEPCLPDFVTDKMREGLRAFERRMRGFAMPDALLTAPETRTSSPVRLARGDDLFSRSLHGLIPCGEGAGYAGGIMSAAVDGIRAAHQVIQELKPVED